MPPVPFLQLRRGFPGTILRGTRPDILAGQRKTGVRMRALLATVGLAALLLPLSLRAQERGAGAEREARIANETGLAVRELYLAPAGPAATDPGPDRLGADTLPHGGTLRLRLGRNQPCQWSLRAILSDGTVEERRGLDLCRAARVQLGQ